MNNTKRIFQRNFHIKKMEQKLSRGFFSFLQTSEKRNLFLPSSLNWMQFIASPKLIFHWLAGSMGHGRQCVSARLPWPRVLICGNWPGDMDSNQWKRRQRDRGGNQSLIAVEYAIGGGEVEVKKKIRREKRQKAMCLPADVWVLSADCKSSGMSAKEKGVI